MERERLSKGRRVNLLMPEDEHVAAHKLSTTVWQSISSLTSMGIVLVRVAVEAARDRHLLRIFDPSGQPIKEIVNPFFSDPFRAPSVVVRDLARSDRVNVGSSTTTIVDRHI